MNSVRVGDSGAVASIFESRLKLVKTVQLLETLPPSKIPVGVRFGMRFRPWWAKKIKISSP